MNAPARLPKLHELPIPRDAQPGPGWTGQMHEMADHIGAHATLSIVDAFGGQQIYVSSKPEQCPFATVVDEATARTIARIYGGNRILIPVGRAAVDRARRAGVIAAVRAGELSGADAQRIIGTSRTYVSHLVNHTDEGQNAAPTRGLKRDPRQPDLFADPAE